MVKRNGVYYVLKGDKEVFSGTRKDCAMYEATSGKKPLLKSESKIRPATKER